MEKINIAELLKDCPKGMELYSPLCGKCVFDRLNFGTIICKKQNTQEITFTCEGYYMLPVFDNCECMIFPSKDQRDWSKFQRPFKDGDVVASALGSQVFILRKATNARQGYCYMGYDFELDKFFGAGEWVFNRLATEEEKEKLFQAIKDNGYKCNAETKTLEKVIELKFKAGDRIRSKNKKDECFYILNVDKDRYKYILNIKGYCLEFKYQNNYELVPNKFDITTLKPFDKVLVRDGAKYEWRIEFFSHTQNEVYMFACLVDSWIQCVPYEGNEHLLGTTIDCDEYYKTWE